MKIQTPYLLFVGDEESASHAKTARGLAYWRPEICMAQCRVDGKGADLGLRDLSPRAAADAGARTMVIGVANIGGFIPEGWTDSIVAALEAGLDIASGLHTRLSDVGAVREAAARTGRDLFDVRHPTQSFARHRREAIRASACSPSAPTAASARCTPRSRSSGRCGSAGFKADFRATGQTGILIAGDGVSIDAVVSDFVSGAVEWLSPANDDDHWDVVEGQGSLLHPAYAGVTLGLVHGSQPDAMVMCHEPTRRHMHGFPTFQMPSIRECMRAPRRGGAADQSGRRCASASASTPRAWTRKRPPSISTRSTDMLDVPCVDPVKTGVGCRSSTGWRTCEARSKTCRPAARSGRSSPSASRAGR